jgi:fructokinase
VERPALIAVAGEALIDLIAEDGVFRPHLGGAGFNTAVALARLGVPAAFLGPVSRDHFGQGLEGRLQAVGVDRRFLQHSQLPTTLALVQTGDGGDAEYAFYLTATAYADLQPADLPDFGEEVVALHVGALALATNPPATALELLMEREAPRRLVMVDPNIRPASAGDPDVFRHRFEHWSATAHVVKLSAADADWLYPGVAPALVLDLVLGRGARLGVITLGADGALARNAMSEVRMAAPEVEVVDTVGAGDAFGAGLIRGLWQAGRLTPQDVGSLPEPELQAAVRLAVGSGALQCARAGAAPPALAEVESFLRGAD